MISSGILNWLFRIQESIREGKFDLAQEQIGKVFYFVRESAPHYFEVEHIIRSMLNREPGYCQVPKEFGQLETYKEDVGMPLTLGGDRESYQINHKPITLEQLREILYRLNLQLPPVLFFGPYNQTGHFLCGPGGRHFYSRETKALGFPSGDKDLGLSKCLDPCYCPEYIKDSYARRNEVEGEYKITYERGMTIIATWDRSIDKRGGSNSAYIALGTYTFEQMIVLAQKSFPERWKLLADRVPIRCIATEYIT